MDCTSMDQAFGQFAEGKSHIPQELLEVVSHTTSPSTSTYLDQLAAFSLRAELTEDIFVHYEPLFLELVARWPSLAGPEAIASAFARLLPVAPYLTFYTSKILPNEAEFRSKLAGISSSSSHDATSLLLTLYRLLSFDLKLFSPFIDLSIIQSLFGVPDRAPRFLAINISCLYLRSSDRTRQELISSNLGDEPVLGIYEGRTFDYGVLGFAEAKRLSDLKERLEKTKSSTQITASGTPHRTIQDSDLSPSTTNIFGVLLPRSEGEPSNSPSVLVDTPTTRANAQAVAVGIRNAKPLLLMGGAGAGKTFVVKEIARHLNRLSSLISIHLGDQTDAKLLIGAYTSGTTSGSFEWRPGVLTTAVREGRWVLIEDIDKAPSEVLSILLPLIERNELVIPARGETIRAASGFQLIATLKTQNEKETTTHMLGNRLWNSLFVKSLEGSELLEVMVRRYPVLEKLAPSLLQVYNEVRSLYKDRTFLQASRASTTRQISPRDLFRWTSRLNPLLLSEGPRLGSDPIPESMFDCIFLETIDCFAASLHTLEARGMVARKIGQTMNIAPRRVDLYLSSHTPEYRNDERHFKVGRAKLQKKKLAGKLKSEQKRPFATTFHALRLLEQIGVSVNMAEPVLLVGETGTGKTTVVQHLADCVRKSLKVVNLSQQTESGDLLGGYKPLEMRTLLLPVKDTFDELFTSTFSAKRDARVIEVLGKCFARQQWSRVITLMSEATKRAEDILMAPEPEADASQPKVKRRKTGTDKEAQIARWAAFKNSLAALEIQAAQVQKSFTFSFVEGSLVQAARKGDWVLLDEINLAAPDTLEAIADLLQDGGGGSIILTEKGDVERIQAHPEFRIFACMNPATDVGKRDLPPGVRSRFTELFVVSPDQDINNLLAVTKEYLGNLTVEDERICADIANLYLTAKKLSEENKLVDGANQRPHFSMRTLTRTLSYAVEITPIYGLRRSIFEGFCMSFLTLLNQESEQLLMPHIEKHILGGAKNAKSLLSQVPRRPTQGDFIQFKHYWMRKGPHPPMEQPHYIITPFVEKNMLNLVRATSTRRFPVLIQGPTSSGKTSMVEYLAKITGHRFVRINNHEHTDLQEYLGSYVSDSSGKLKFQEGILVEALRNGDWIVLDELNLAPTDVLEALNRLLDDNRELLIPETQEVVRPHPDFMLFATQNPPGLYGGRKMLSRAFRNRFLELHFDDIPEDELETIIRERCQIAPSYCAKIVAVYQELAILRQSTRLFERKNSFATLRDLFRWANREAIGYQQLAENGYMLLAERVRKEDEKLAVKQVIEKIMRVKIPEGFEYQIESLPEYQQLLARGVQTELVWTKAMKRLFTLVSHALRNNEPVLLIGETGSGKTSVCQILAQTFAKELHIVNAHQNLETGDIIGAQRPVRNRSEATAQLVADLRGVIAASLPEPERATVEALSLAQLVERYSAMDRSDVPTEIQARIESNHKLVSALFEWKDGTLVQAMKEGNYFLLDEISLADDSVLERLNSVLEQKRSIILAEKGPDCGETIAAEGFQFLATMNPGGDYGKKELSPALRNRFTEIWVPAMTDSEDMLEITRSKLHPDAAPLASAIVDFSRWYGERYNFASATTISIRNILAWAKFININMDKGVEFGFVHGAALVYIDGLGANPSAVLSISSNTVNEEKQICVKKLSELAGKDLLLTYQTSSSLTISEGKLSLGPFTIDLGEKIASNVPFSFDAATTSLNAMRILRAMQLKKPILLEGSPGVGKTSLVSALASITGNPLTRINLSEQTDLMDLFGSDVPVEGGSSGEFAWRDAPFLQAMQKGHWVLLDEMNLASQSVLEGLNACLDHRGEAYIAELDRTFKLHPNCMVLAAQNPHHQGGGRKGLPASFVNRFTVVFVDAFTEGDLQLITQKLYPNVDHVVAAKLISFICQLQEETCVKHTFGSVGSPWEFNLRDVLKWIGILSIKEGIFKDKPAEEYLDIVIRQRFRTLRDRSKVDDLFKKSYRVQPKKRNIYYQLQRDYFQVGHALLPRNNGQMQSTIDNTAILPSQLDVLESVMTCVHQNWPCILVGPSGSGKSSIIKLVANVVGAEICELALNSDIDTMDIVGGFEQIDNRRKCSAVIDRLLVRFEALVQDAITKAVKIGKNAADLLTLLRSDALSSDSSRFQQTLDQFQHAISGDERCEQLLQELRDLVAKNAADSLAKFEWVDGMLVQAVEEGRWLILDNANLCSPSVLDRLNSLLEPNGVLIMNEHSDKDGQPRLVTPHPNFRLFLTVDPKHGELSRAMRNRAVEIYIGLHDANQENALEVRRKQSSELAPNIVKDSSLFALDTLPKLEGLSDIYFLDVIRAFVYHLNTGQISLLRRHDGTIDVQLWELDSDKQQSLHEVLEDVSDLLSNEEYKKLAINFARSATTHFSLDLHLFQSQPIHPLVNTALLKCSSGDDSASCEDKFELFALAFENALQIIGMGKLDGSVVHRSTTTNLERLTLRDRDVARGARQKSTARLTKLLVDLRNCFMLWLSKLSPFTAGISEQKAVASLIQLWQDLAEVSISAQSDDSVVRVYVELIQVWLTRWSKTLPPDLSAAFEKKINSFAKNYELTTGAAMQLIWDRQRPSVPESLDTWNKWLELEAAAKRFDGVAVNFGASNKNVRDVRRAIVEALATALSYGDIPEDIVKELNSAITELEGAGRQKRKGLFTSEFNKILTCLELGIAGSNKSAELNDTILSLSLGAARSSLDLLQFQAQKSKLAFSYDSVLKSLWSGTDEDITGPDMLLGNIVGRDITAKSALVNMSSIGDLPLTRTDQDELGYQFASQLSSLKASHLGSLARLLKKNLRKIFETFSMWLGEIAGPSFSPMISDFLGLSTAASVKDSDLPNKQQVDAAMQGFLLPALSRLQSIHGETLTSENATKALGEAWTLYALGCITLYVPSAPFDPARKKMTVRDRYLRNKTRLHQQLNAFVFFEKNFSGDDDNRLIQRFREQIEELGSEPDKSTIARPAISQLSELQAEFENVLTTLQPHQFRTFVLEKLLLEDSAVLEQEKNLQKNLSMIIERLQEGYPIYKDIVDLVVGYLYSLRLGLSLLAHRNEKEKTSIPREALSPTIFLQDASKAVSEVFTTSRDEKLFRLSLLNVQHRVEGNSSAPIEAFDYVLNNLFERWRATIEEEKAEAAAKSSMYRYQGLEEDAEDKDFRSMFPDVEAEDEEEEEGPKQSHKDLARQIAALHFGLYSRIPGSENLLAEQVKKAVKLLSNDAEARSGSFSNWIAADILAMGEAQAWINGKVNSKLYDFYHDENLSEAWGLVTVIEKVKARFTELITFWPEHVTLHDTLDQCKDIVALPSSTPLAKFLVKLERLHGTVNEWQGVASREYSAADQFNSLTNLIIRWRRLELETWPRLLDLEEEKAREEADSFWFFLYESIVANSTGLLEQASSEDFKGHVEELSVTLCTFLTSSSMGQFSRRLALLRVFSKYIKQLVSIRPKGIETVYSTIRNILAYFTGFLPQCEESLKAQRKTVEKEVTDVVLLASWKDTNITALRDSAKRSHHKLYKVVRKYRDALSAPATAMFQASLPEVALSERIFSTNVVVDKDFLVKAGAVCQKKLSSWTQRPKRLLEVQNSAQALLRVYEGTVTSFNAAASIQQFTTGVIATVKELQAETPSVLTEENADAVKHLKSRKRKAFTDALKFLRQMGLRSNLSSTVMAAQASMEKIMASVPTLDSNELDTEDASKLFSRALEFLPAVRRTLADHSADLTGPEVVRGVGYIEHLVNIQMEQRKSTASALAELDAVASTIRTFNRFSGLLNTDSEIIWNESKGQEGCIELQRRCKWLPHVFNYAYEILQTHSRLRGKSYSDAEAALRKLSLDISAIEKMISSISALSGDLWSNPDINSIQSVLQSIQNIREALVQQAIAYPEIDYIYDIILPWLSEIQAPSGRQRNGVKTLEELDKMFQELCNSIFVALQQLKSMEDSLKTTEEDAGWFLKYNTALSQVVKNLHMKRVNELMGDLVGKLMEFHVPSKEDSLFVSALFAHHQPILEAYGEVCKNALARNLNFQESIAKMTRTISATETEIAKNGFCTPPEKSDEKGGDSAGVESGTGLGNGEGMDDISKDVGADEDLTEMAQDKGSEEDKKDIEDEKDAVDIEDDLEGGEMGDAPDKEDGEDEEGEGDEEKELDEETGDVDDLDPNAVDEKMWDGEEDEDARDKEGEGKSEKQQKGEEMEAKKNESMKNDAGEEGDMEKEEEGDEGDEEEEGPDHSDEVKQQDGEQMDQHVPEVDTLDLPEDIELDANEKEENGGVEEEDDIDMGELEDEKETKEDDGKGDEKEDENFPEPKEPDSMDIGEDENSKEQEEKETEEGLQDEENEEMGEQNDEEKDPLRTQSEDKPNAAPPEEQVPSEVQGVDGNEDKDDDLDKQNAARQESGQQSTMDDAYDGEGAKEAEAEGNMGERTSKSEASNKQSEPEESAAEKSAFKKLGDALEKFHRQYQEILEAKEDAPEENEAENKMDVDDAEYEHLPNDEVKHDTQALGAANEEQARHLDDSMAIDSGEKEALPEAPEDEQEEGGESESQKPREQIEDEVHESTQQGGEGTGAIVGRQNVPADEDMDNVHEKMDIDDFEELEDFDDHEAATTNCLDIQLAASSDARATWQKYEQQTRELATGLCEQLRLVLEPTLATKMRGDFRTGKRLNMKRIIPYIASQYKKDKIWMRRTKPSKRQYQVMIAVDDSRSMAESNSVDLTYKTVALISKALSQLEVGQISIASFGENTSVLHPFDKPFTSDSGASAFSGFTFAQLSTNVSRLLETSLTYFSNNAMPTSQNANVEIAQLQLIISDGICDDHAYLRRLVRRAKEMRIMIVFVIIDAGRSGGGSILDMKEVKFDEGGALRMERYLDGFPFEYYLVVKNVVELPGVLAGALRQWLAEIVESS